MPRVSVLMAVYDGMPYLPEAVASIRGQTLEDWELVIVDDGSTDASVGYLDAQDDPRIRVIRQPNAGLAAALNRGLAACRAPYTARMDADDVSHPTRLAKQVAWLDAHPEVGLLGTQYVPRGETRVGRPSALALDHDEIVRRLMKALHGICHPTIVCRTPLLERIGGYWDQGLGEEWDLYLRMAEVGRVANLDEVLLTYRFHTSSLNAQKLADLRAHIAYACECARRRAAGEAPVAFETYAASNRRPALGRLGWRIENHALVHYRKAVCDQLAGRPVRGTLRLGWAALCSPRLALPRVGRVVRRAFGRGSAQ